MASILEMILKSKECSSKVFEPKLPHQIILFCSALLCPLHPSLPKLNGVFPPYDQSPLFKLLGLGLGKLDTPHNVIPTPPNVDFIGILEVLEAPSIIRLFYLVNMCQEFIIFLMEFSLNVVLVIVNFCVDDLLPLVHGISTVLLKDSSPESLKSSFDFGVGINVSAHRFYL